MPDAIEQSPPPEGTGRSPHPSSHHKAQGMTFIYPPTDGTHSNALADCSRAFSQGNYHLARQLARQVEADSPSPAEHQFAQQILHRTGIDPVALGIGLACLVLFGLVVWWAT